MIDVNVMRAFCGIAALVVAWRAFLAGYGKKFSVVPSGVAFLVLFTGGFWPVIAERYVILANAGLRSLLSAIAVG